MTIEFENAHPETRVSGPEFRQLLNCKRTKFHRLRKEDPEFPKPVIDRKTYLYFRWGDVSSYLKRQGRN